LLKNVKLEAKKGEIIGLFGKSGGGKSTIIKVILGFLGGNENYVKINNIPLRELELDSYYRRICYVPQHPVVFKGTVKENIFLGDNGKLDKMLLEFLDDLSLEREVEEGGRNLSGGELQRIAIVRAFVQKNKDLYLLDEPTTHLDIKKTEKLRELISLKSKNSIILIVSHSKIFLEKTCNKIVEI
jgi:ABC-type transport system involved in cytochrome bd biosynthesis fused ATPase/permease subunit